ncbi:MAG: hypothetical protein OHK0029_37520 [Armatimonadaceae bacterium]
MSFLSASSFASLPAGWKIRAKAALRWVAGAVLVFLTGSLPAFAQNATPAPDDLPIPTPGVSPKIPPSTASRRPDLFAPLPFYERRNNYFFAGAADLRYRTLTSSGEDETIGSYVSAARFTGEYIRANPSTGDERGGVRLQFLLESDNRGTRLNRLRMSEAYVFYRFLFPGVSATIRAGQFVLPFGLIAVYDTPLQPIQPLYERALGLRVDTGLMLEGDYGPYHYAASITRGVGPNKQDEDSMGVLAFRLSRVLPAQLGNFRFGQLQLSGSLLSGRLPVTGFSTELPPSGFTGASVAAEYVKKTRFAADAIYEYGPFLGRGEIVFGSDDQEPVWGYFAEGNYQVVSRLTAVAFARRWNFPVRPERAQAYGVGLNYTFGKELVLRSLFEYEEQIPADGSLDRTVIRRFTLQTRLNF